MIILDISNFLHYIGIAFGLGGATIATIISMKAEKNKDKEMDHAVMKLMSSISKVIFLGLILLVISGILLTIYAPWPLNKKMLAVKHVLVAWIFIIAIPLGRKSIKMRALVPIGKQKPSEEFLKYKKQIRGLSMINLVLWYAITFMSIFV